MRAQELSFEEIEKGDPEHRLCNRDLAPASSDDRVWNGYSLFSLWMNDATMHRTTLLLLRYLLAPGR